MKPILPVVMALASLAALPGQQPVPAPASAAEQQFRDAWWAETAQTDLEAALRGYLAAAAADGPATVRAKALLQAGRVQQRLGRTEAALATFRKLVMDHAGEREVVEQARAHLRELTAVDLRRNYDEWYERRLFSEDVQLSILAKLDALAGKLARRPEQPEEQKAHAAEVLSLMQEIAAYGKGAVPALRKTATGSNVAMRQHAIHMLFELRELPPLPALLADDGWLGDADSWPVLLQQKSDAEVPPSPVWYRPLLTAALRGGAALADALVHATRRPQDDNLVSTIALAALHAEGGKAVVLAALADPGLAINLRLGIESGLLNDVDGDTALTAAEWLAVSAEPLRYQLRQAGILHAAALLGPGDGAQLDEILARITAGTPSQQGSLAIILSLGLDRQMSLDVLPWTPARVRTVLQLATSEGGTGCFSQLWLALLRPPAKRAVLAEAVFSQPILCHDAPDARQFLHRHFQFDIGEGDNELLASGWHAALAAVLAREWDRWSDDTRVDALAMLGTVMHQLEPGPVVRFLDKVKDKASAPVRQAIDALPTSG